MNSKMDIWERKYKSIPKEVHEAYLMESQGNLTYLLLNLHDGVGLIEYVNSNIQANYNPDYSKTFKESIEELDRLVAKKMRAEKRSENKIRKKRVELWDKHYSKYGLEFID